MSDSICFPYKIYKHFPAPIVPVSLFGKDWFETEAYVDSGAAFSLFSPMEAQRLSLDYTRGRKMFSVVGDGSLIPVFLHKIKACIGPVTLTATIGFSPRLGVGFNLLGRRDFFTTFDVLFSDSSRTITFLPQK